MASNPMQRKARNAFLLGFLIALAIAAVVIFFLFTKLQAAEKETKEEKKETEAASTMLYVAAQPIKSGDRLNGKIAYKAVKTDTVPANAVTINDLALYSTAKEATPSEMAGLLDDAAVARINIEPGTIITTDMMIQETSGVYKFNWDIQKLEDGTEVKTLKGIDKDSSVRLEEYNMLAIPSKLEAGQYIDIRFQMPTGETFIVVSKKYVEDTDETTIWLKMSEAEILAMNNAIVEAYTMTGSKLYANVYVEAGDQDKADVTYVPSNAVVELIKRDPNVIESAKEYLKVMYNGNDLRLYEYRDQVINSSLEAYKDDRAANTEAGIKAEIEQLQTSRQKYLEQVGAYTDSSSTTETGTY